MKTRAQRNKSMFVIVIVIVVAVGLLGFGQIFGGIDVGPQTTRELAMSCTLDMYTKFHIHPNLKIILNGGERSGERKLPSNIGVSFSCMHPLHTHDETGKIHVESPEPRDFTLGDFFAVWDKPFSKNQILDYRADAGHEVIMMVDGEPSAEFENLVFRDNQQIVIEYRPLQK